MSTSADKTVRPADGRRLVLIDAAVLPDSIRRTLQAKHLLQTGRAATVSQAAKAAGISRTAFYKYRDAVWPYEEASGRTITVHLVLQHTPGVISRVLEHFARAGANILTVSQNIPSGGLANASVSARVDQLRIPVRDFLASLETIEGVKRASGTADD